jgi:hypothetical protein
LRFGEVKYQESAQWWVAPMAERRKKVTDLSIEPVFFCVDIESMTGLREIPEA